MFKNKERRKVYEKKYFNGGNDRITIHKFMRIYIGLECVDPNLTHSKMVQIIDYKNEELKRQMKKESTKWTGNFFQKPCAVSFEVSKEDIKTGKYVAVIDAKKAIVYYKNPLLHSLEELQSFLREEAKEEVLELRRLKYLFQNGYVEYDDEPTLHQIDIEESMEEKEESTEEETYVIKEKNKYAQRGKRATVRRNVKW